MKKLTLIIACSISLLFVATAAKPANEGNLKEQTIMNEKTIKQFTDQVNKHLRAIQKRDIKLYAQTISKDPSLTIMFKDGGIIKGYDEAIALHKNWFGMKWKIKNTIEEIHVYGDTARALIHMELEMYPPNVDPVQEDNYVTLIFQKESDGWKLVFDQCTPIMK